MCPSALEVRIPNYPSNSHAVAASDEEEAYDDAETARRAEICGAAKQQIDEGWLAPIHIHRKLLFC
jgi:hypothetical protein